ncbi:hypothetical protein VUJ46_19910 [Chryseobacterium sp. MYb264]|uniref:hypothetical protein n=1 Tax=Chryseobacterium sp. MYb264 TaxID=2745153 RepID=UPI002E127B70|nr:hypothetical protein VUJ46_19910 [Chryseobacterium sp. MYb264]
MKTLLQPLLLGLFALSLAACKNSPKEAEILTDTNDSVTHDDIVKNVYTDNNGEKIEVSINHTQNTAVVHLDGKTYDLQKSDGFPDYTASNAEYQYSNIRGNITFLKKNYDMVLFSYKENGKDKSATKMASY